MPEINLDTDQSLAEPLKLTIDGTTHTITKITQETWDKVLQEKDITKQLAYIVGAKPETFRQADTRKIARAMRLLFRWALEPLQTLAEPEKKE